jgi:hypothetical protein
MKRLALRTENQWRSLKDGAGVDLLRVSFTCNAFQLGVAITLAGFGVGLTWWARERGEEYRAEGDPSSVTLRYDFECCTGDGISLHTRTYAWEPIETNGWAGEPHGREKAP